MFIETEEKKMRLAEYQELKPRIMLNNEHEGTIILNQIHISGWYVFDLEWDEETEREKLVDNNRLLTMREIIKYSIM